MKHKPIDTEQIKANADLRETARAYTSLHSESRDELSGPCPKCGGRDRFHCQKEWFFCRECHPKRGNIFEFFIWKDGVSFLEAATLANGGVAPSPSPSAQPKRKAERQPREEWNEAAQMQKAINAYDLLMTGRSREVELGWDYLLDRGILLETAHTFKLGLCRAGLPATWNQADRSRTYPRQWAILLPWLDATSHLVGVRYRFLEAHTYPNIKGETITHSKSSEYRSDFTGVFGWQAVKGPARCDVLIITEGEINALSLWQAGKGRVDVLSPGSESTVKALPKDVATLARQYAHVIVWADKGNIADDTARAIGAASMRSPKGMDANDLLKAGKLEMLLAAMLDRIGATPTAQEGQGEALQNNSVG